MCVYVFVCTCGSPSAQDEGALGRSQTARITTKRQCLLELLMRLLDTSARVRCAPVCMRVWMFVCLCVWAHTCMHARVAPWMMESTSGGSDQAWEVSGFVHTRAFVKLPLPGPTPLCCV